MVIHLDLKKLSGFWRNRTANSKHGAVFFSSLSAGFGSLVSVLTQAAWGRIWGPAAVGMVSILLAISNPVSRVTLLSLDRFVLLPAKNRQGLPKAKSRTPIFFGWLILSPIPVCVVVFRYFKESSPSLVIATTVMTFFLSLSLILSAVYRAWGKVLMAGLLSRPLALLFIPALMLAVLPGNRLAADTTLVLGSIFSVIIFALIALRLNSKGGLDVVDDRLAHSLPQATRWTVITTPLNLGPYLDRLFIAQLAGLGLLGQLHSHLYILGLIYLFTENYELQSIIHLGTTGTHKRSIVGRLIYHPFSFGIVLAGCSTFILPYVVRVLFGHSFIFGSGRGATLLCLSSAFYFVNANSLAKWTHCLNTANSWKLFSAGFFSLLLYLVYLVLGPHFIQDRLLWACSGPLLYQALRYVFLSHVFDPGTPTKALPATDTNLNVQAI
jgi:hypothetical protein